MQKKINGGTQPRPALPLALASPNAVNHGALPMALAIAPAWQMRWAAKRRLAAAEAAVEAAEAAAGP
eukprot:74891-Chlamydomonas_euryale.AAC.7